MCSKASCTMRLVLGTLVKTPVAASYAHAIANSNGRCNRENVDRLTFSQVWQPMANLVTRPKYPPYREAGVAIPLSHCVSYGIADHRCYAPTSFHKNGLSQSKDRPNKGVSQKKLASKAYRAKIAQKTQNGPIAKPPWGCCGLRN